MAETKKNYNFKKIEDTWRPKWYADNIYEAVDFSEKPKKYILAELPYPSGKFLHIGHMFRYTVPEIYSRFLRMRGYNVLYPMGWDSFGLPAETHAIKEKITPQEAIATATKNYKLAMQNMGYGIDWNREINTSDPQMYKWTQWMFIKLWEAGLAELQEMPVWWCQELGVLADEEVLPTKDGGKISERGGYAVERRLFKQWVLKIPEYAERLLADLDLVDYADSVKQGQRNWIGKKEGALITFELAGEPIEVFTTRPDTLFGVTFLAVSPQHFIIEQLKAKITNYTEVQEYIENAKNLTDMEKQTKEKTGVLVKGVTAIHPFSEVKREIPVFVADYILLDYGTGVIMGVPGHDERDNEFAKKYGLEIIEVIKNPDEAGDTDPNIIYAGQGTVINSAGYDGQDSENFKKTVIDRLTQENKGKPEKMYKIRNQVFSRQRYWGEPIPLLYKEDGSIEAVQEKDLPVELPVMQDFLAGKDGISPLAKNKDWVETTDSTGKPAKRETDTMPTWAGSNWYYIRYLDPHNDEQFADFEKMNYWLPVDNYFGTAAHTTAHLIYARFWYKFLYDQGCVPTPEPFNFRMSGGLLLGPDNHVMSKSRGNIVDPKDVLENYGADAARVYLAFIGPYEDTYPWNENGIMACFRLVKTIFELQNKVTSKALTETSEINKSYHKMVKNMTDMLEKLKMNTAVSEIMIFVNLLKKEKEIPNELWQKFILVIAPFAPFLAEELWQTANTYKKWQKENSVHLQPWPEFNDKLTMEDKITIPVQINGKVRDTIEISRNSSENEVKAQILKNEKIAGYIREKTITQFIYIPAKIVNIVVS